MDPFGYSDSDSTQIPNNFVKKAGNTLHLKTKNIAIKNLLLIKKNKPLDSLLVKESERIIRSQRFTRSVTSHMKVVSGDSVDVYVRVLDSWSLIPDASTSTSKSKFYLKDKNIFGLGHEFSNSYTKSLKSNQEGYSTSYFIPTFLNSFISTRLDYEIDLDRNYAKSIDIQRPFFSSYTRWAAGINLGQNLNRILTLDFNQVESIQSAKFNYQDYWAGHAFRIFKENTEYSRTTNFVTSARFYNKNYVEKPFVNLDSLDIYASEKLYLISFGITSRKFTQDKYIFNFNVVEDVASGFVYNITTGYQKKYGEYKFYAGARVEMGNYFKFGYLSGNLETGTFLDLGKTNQTVTSLRLTYFTNLLEIGKWKFRQFIKPQLIIGNNRLDSNYDRLTLNGDDNGIDGFSSTTLFGTKKLLMTVQTQGYSPWRVIGFRLNPYLSYTAGMLGQKDIGFSNSKLYSQISAGVIISNDYLIFNSFQFSLSYYPNIPDGNSIFKTNAISTSDFRLQNFELSKPSLISY
ncbi:hypothetical protein G6N05_02925 [Flavobacterium sp. F372]|uniref:Haemolysin activator HlyB C-terminal domain-containing protein n=1 Tax=Flavobacterium bernardetii TaxID=2813823 RepID=A0ABR7IVK8_9FLAO|nr:hypothetical protein [Flavobacterium bernardetii]NHF69062.1 hypothetical protein [Flavobacterium bernardetii]